MIKILLAVLFIVSGCKSGTDHLPAENAFDAGREFVDACLKGDFSKASFYMLQDATNTRQLSQLKKDYEASTAEKKQNYAAASINILEDEPVNDSMEIINYKNSFDGIARKVKVVLINGKWLVDLKYTSSGNL